MLWSYCVWCRSKQIITLTTTTPCHRPRMYYFVLLALSSQSSGVEAKVYHQRITHYALRITLVVCSNCIPTFPFSHLVKKGVVSSLSVIVCKKFSFVHVSSICIMYKLSFLCHANEGVSFVRRTSRCKWEIVYTSFVCRISPCKWR